MYFEVLGDFEILRGKDVFRRIGGLSGETGRLGDIR